MPKTSLKDRVTSATEDLIAILTKPHPLTPFLDQGTKTNVAIQNLQEIFTLEQRNEASTKVLEQVSLRMNQTAIRVELPTIDEDEI